jgi:hypothetical protein
MSKCKIAIIYLSFLVLCSCSESEDIIQKELTEIITGEFVLKKDDDISQFSNLRVIDNADNGLIYFPVQDQKKNLLRILFFNITEGTKEFEVFIPLEGPDSIKGALGAYSYVKGENEIFLLGRTGILGKYDYFGKKIMELDLNMLIPEDIEFDFQRITQVNGGVTMIDNVLQVLFNPGYSEFDKEIGKYVMKFPIDYSNWMFQIDVNNKEFRVPQFSIPHDYQKFEFDPFASQLSGVWNKYEGFYYLIWPYSNVVYQISEDGEFFNQFSLQSGMSLNFIPGEIKDAGQGFQAFITPKEASSHLFLAYDDDNELYIRLSKMDESGEGFSSFYRSKNYLITFYNSTWNILGEYFFMFEKETEIDNWFLYDNELFINQPNQSNEDEYKFFRIDLSKVKK